jgi:hypothetical protein
MTTPYRQSRSLCRLATTAGLAMLFALAGGCKSKDGGSPGKSDPLMAGPGRIPPQNLPLPDRGGIGSKGKTDPLIGNPTGKPGDKSGVGYNDDPERFKGTHIPGAGSTPAALAGKGRDGDELKIDDGTRGVPLTPAGGMVGSTAPVAPVEANEADGLFTELARYGVTRDDRSLGRENNQYVFRASVPISGNGAKRQYTGVGETAQEAVKQVLDQVIADRK